MRLSLLEQRLARNNFDLLRLLFAAMVCLVHSYELSRIGDLKWLAATFSSDLAVKAFFVVSGFLIFMSHERSSSLGSYASKRLRRIYPAYFTVIMLAALGLVLVSDLAPADYFTMAWAKYVVANLTFLNFLQPTLPGVFEANRVAAINGALWTLKIEVMFYLSVPILAWLFRRFARLPAMLLVYCASIAYATALSALADNTGRELIHELARQLPGQLSYFIGSALLYYLPVFDRYRLPFLALAAACLLADGFLPLGWVEPLALAVLVVFCGLYVYLGNFGKYGDFSYGLYILHFPIIQLYAQAEWGRGNPYLFLTAVVLTSLFGAVLMWHLVEKRFLFRSSHYVSSASADGDAERSGVAARGA